MPDNDISSSSSKMPPPPNKKRRSSATLIAPQPTQVALPPPLVSYPPPHLMPSYYHVYHQHPYFLSVGGPQPPISPSLSPTLSTLTSSTTTTATTPTPAATPTAQRILPKSPTSTPTSTATSPSTLAPSFNFYPYPMQISPQLHPTVNVPPPPSLPVSPVPFGIRQNSVSSTASNSTADQREQARKVSHSAIERRRREKINDKILQLRDLIPSCSNRENLHKMTILQSAIDYITYLKKVIEDSSTTKGDDQSMPEVAANCSTAKETTFTGEQFSAHSAPPPTQQQEAVISDYKSIAESEEDVAEASEDDQDKEVYSWSMLCPNNRDNSGSNKVQHAASMSSPNVSPVTPLPSSGLKPMDVIKLNQKSLPNTLPSPPKIIVNSHQDEPQESASFTHTERNMNLENILC